MSLLLNVHYILYFSVQILPATIVDLLQLALLIFQPQLIDHPLSPVDNTPSL